MDSQSVEAAEGVLDIAVVPKPQIGLTMSSLILRDPLAHSPGTCNSPTERESGFL
jgi:hypothetical protein